MRDQHPPSTLTLEDVKSLAAQLGVTITLHGQSFDLDKQEPLAFEGTYRKVQAGIDAAYNSLVRYQANLSNIPTSLKNPTKSCGRSTAGAFLLCFLALLTVFTIGTFSPQTRGITNPLTVLFTVLVLLSACKLMFSRTQK